ncbi:hypothetical protein C8Q75DRAFT_810263 [Abortiporus biennis]|nr:hypothetical protein C8Q75DRAFT_810263 [Abortiporus biennis]
MSKSDAFELLDKQEDVVKQHIQSIRSLRAKLSFILTQRYIPDELLASVFRILRDGYQELLYRIRHQHLNPLDRDSKWKEMWDWTTVMRVGKWWRSVALGNGILWQDVDIHGINGVSRGELFIARSHTAPLNISVENVDSDFLSARFWNLVQQNAYRINRLWIDIPIPQCDDPRNIQTVSTDFIPLPLSIVTSLRLEARAFRLEEHFIPPFIDQPINASGTLRKLKLEAVVIAFSHFTPQLCSHLEVLNLSDGLALHTHTNGVPSMSTFLDILRSCVSLRKLKLSGSGPRYHSPTGVESMPTKFSPVKLTRLQYISIHNPPQDIQFLLSHLILPTNVSIILSISFNNILSQAEVDADAGLYKILPKDLSGMIPASPSEDNPKALTFSAPIHISCYLFDIEASEMDLIPPRKIFPGIRSKRNKFSMTQQYSYFEVDENLPGIHAATLKTIGSVFSHWNVQELHIGKGDIARFLEDLLNLEHMTMMDWVRILYDLPLLKKISFDYPRAAPHLSELDYLEQIVAPVCLFLNSLYYEEMSSSLPHSGIICPKLTHLSLYVDRHEVNLEDTIQTCVKERSEKGVKIMYLHIFLGEYREDDEMHIDEIFFWPDLSVYVHEFAVFPLESVPHPVMI